jgi:hypothetical protein
MIRKLITSSAAVFLLVLPSMAQEFLPFEGKQTVYEGNGGTRRNIDGIDFWENGDPPKKYMLLGYITDRRHKTGIWGAISMSNLETDVAKVAKQAGADAVILVSSDTETTGSTGYVPPNGGARTIRPVQKFDSKYAVIKYVVDAPQP